MEPIIVQCMGNKVIEARENMVVLNDAGEEKVIPITSIDEIRLGKPPTFWNKCLLWIKLRREVGAYVGIVGFAVPLGGTIVLYVAEDVEYHKAVQFRSYVIEKQKSMLMDSHNSKTDDDVYSDIEKLHALKGKGIITQEEFEAKKKQLLEL